SRAEPKLWRLLLLGLAHEELVVVAHVPQRSAVLRVLHAREALAVVNAFTCCLGMWLLPVVQGWSAPRGVGHAAPRRELVRVEVCVQVREVARLVRDGPAWIRRRIRRLRQGIGGERTRGGGGVLRLFKEARCLDVVVKLDALRIPGWS